MIHFVVHDEGDSVGVVVVEGVKAGQKLTGWIMDQDREIQMDARSDIPIGHKLAIKPLSFRGRALLQEHVVTRLPRTAIVVST